MFFWNKKRLAKERAEAKREAQIKRIQEETDKKIDTAVRSTERAIQGLSGEDIAENLYFATGGGRRHVRR